MAEYFWNELCIICGRSPDKSVQLFPEQFQSEVSDSRSNCEELVNIIKRFDPSLSDCLKDESLVSIISEAIKRHWFPPPEVVDSFRLDATQYPGGMEGDHIAIGHFMSTGFLPCGCPRPSENPVSKSLYMDGKGVQTLVVSEPSNGSFQRTEGYIGDPDAIEPDWVPCSAIFSEGFGNFFMCRMCFYMLDAWLDRSRFANIGPLDFAGEFYEVVNSREKGRRTIAFF